MPGRASVRMPRHSPGTTVVDDGARNARRQTGAAAAASPEMARARQARARADDPRAALLLFGFSLSVMFDIVTRTIGHPWLWLQEVTSTLFIYAIFIGAAVATRRNDHLYLTAVSEALHGTPRTDRRDHHPPRRARRRVLPDLFRLHQFPARLRQLPAAVDHADRLALCGDPDLRRADRAVHDRAARQRLRNGFDHPEPRRTTCGDPADCDGAADRESGRERPAHPGSDDVLLPVLRLSRRAGAVLADGRRVRRRAASPTSRSPRSSRRCSTAWIPRRCWRSRSSCWSAS